MYPEVRGTTIIAKKRDYLKQKDIFYYAAKA
jgi:hypothetical protein